MLTYTIGTSVSSAKKAYLNDAMREVYGPNWDINPVKPSDFQMVIKSVPFGQMNLSQSTLSQAEVTNTEKLSDGTSERHYHIYILNRRQKIVINNRTVILDPGDFTFQTSTDNGSRLRLKPLSFLYECRLYVRQHITELDYISDEFVMILHPWE